MIEIDVLPDEVLLGVFDFYVGMSPSYEEGETEAWRSLVHVCRRWRSLVLESPRRLNLRLVCTPKTAAKDTLNVWRAWPLIVTGDITFSSAAGKDNVIAALGQSNRIYKVNLHGLADWQLEEVLAAMQASFPELTELRFSSCAKTPPVIHDSFLNGSAPRLRSLELDEIPFPGLPKLLLSATHLVHLVLSDIPHSGYISPEAMVDVLCALSSLEKLILEFPSPQSRPDLESRSPPPPKLSILPALDDFHFKGGTEYLEDLVTRIDAPQLKTLGIMLFNRFDFDTPQLSQFIIRTPKLGRRDAHVRFDYWGISIALQAHSGTFKIEILCRDPDLKLWSVTQFCNSSLPPLSTVKDLYIEREYSELVWKNDAIKNTRWLELLLPFTAVKSLYISKEFAPGIAPALQELVGARIAEVLPNLQNIFVEGLEPWGSFQETIGQFADARRRSGHPIAISVWSDLE